MKKTNNTYYTKIIQQLPRFATMEKILEFLRQFNFAFVEMDTFEELHKDYPFHAKDRKASIMLRELKPGVWDIRMLVCIKLWGKRSSRVAIYLNGEYNSRLEKHWKDKEDFNFKKLDIKLKFPDGLTYEERKKWRYEDKKVQAKPNYQPSAWYNEWKDQVIRL